MNPEDQAIYRSDEGPAITVTQITKYEVKFKFVTFIGHHPLIAHATMPLGEFQEVLAAVGYTAHKISDHVANVTVEDLICLGISLAQG